MVYLTILLSVSFLIMLILGTVRPCFILFDMCEISIVSKIEILDMKYIDKVLVIFQTSCCCCLNCFDLLFFFNFTLVRKYVEIAVSPLKSGARNTHTSLITVHCHILSNKSSE